MKLTLRELRQIIKENEYLRGVPEFLIDESIRKFCDEMKKHVKSFILVDKSTSQEEQADAISAMNEAIEKLQENVSAEVDKTLWNFLSRV